MKKDPSSGHYVILSTFIHFIIFVFIATRSGGLGSLKRGGGASDNEPSKYKGVEVGSVLEKQKVEVDVIYKPVENKDTATINTPKQQNKLPIIKECPGKWYGGIGIELYYGECISEIFKGYGADIAGLKVGDCIVWCSDKEILGTPGTSMTMRIRRGQEYLTFFVTRVKVCY